MTVLKILVFGLCFLVRGASNLLQFCICFASECPSCFFYDEYSREQTGMDLQLIEEDI